MFMVLTRLMRSGLLVVPCTTCFLTLMGCPANGRTVFLYAITMANWERWTLIEYVINSQFDSMT
jgi:hypothetical protein